MWGTLRLLFIGMLRGVGKGRCAVAGLSMALEFPQRVPLRSTFHHLGSACQHMVAWLGGVRE